MASAPMPSVPAPPATAVNPIMAIVLVCLLSAFFMLCMVSTYFRYYAERQLRLAASTTHGSETTGSMRLVVHGLDPAIIATFPSFLYSTVKGIKLGHTALECAVCLNEFQDHETLRLLPICSHVFHQDCVDTWLASQVTCPVCRANLIQSTNEPSQTTEQLHNPVDLERDSSSTEFLLQMESKHLVGSTTHIPRSHSTGHSVVVQPIKNTERYTLRLPNEARGMFMNPVTSLPASPHTMFPTESSKKMTFRSVSVGSTTRLDHYVQFEQSNPERPGGETSRGANDLTTSSSQRFVRSVRSPFNHLFPASNRNLDV